MSNSRLLINQVHLYYSTLRNHVGNLLPYLDTRFTSMLEEGGVFTKKKLGLINILPLKHNDFTRSWDDTFADRFAVFSL